MIKMITQLISNMGVKYVAYRIWHEIERRSGWYSIKFPVKVGNIEVKRLRDWRNQASDFLISEREKFSFPKSPNKKLAAEAADILNGELKYFGKFDLKNDSVEKWLSNPRNSYTYPLVHWSKVPDYSPKAGDIKWVWEKSRFSFIQTIIRYDYHHDKDSSEWVFSQIDDWIMSNPVNMGPNWRCSQEISLRLINWCYALWFYKNSKNLTEGRWELYNNIIYWQLHHVYNHIYFSKIAVRNNHAITETGMLYIAGHLFSHLPNVAKWSAKGKAWLEKEVEYQILEDGSSIQYSFNYQRVVLQLLTVFLSMSNKSSSPLSSKATEKVCKGHEFLSTFILGAEGSTPNYGANDGSNYFKFHSGGYFDYRPTIDTLSQYLGKSSFHTDNEQAYWMGISRAAQPKVKHTKSIFKFDQGGYYLIKDSGADTYLRAGNHDYRPSQADNGHLDIWIGGENVFIDSGTYQYVSEDPELQGYFESTGAHNTLMINSQSQMEKGSRFIWYNWSKLDGNVSINEYGDRYVIEACLKVYQFLDKDMRHSRQVVKYKNQHRWTITDRISPVEGYEIRQLWNVNPKFEDRVHLSATDNTPIEPRTNKRWASLYYGDIQPVNQVFFATLAQEITTEVVIDV